MKVKLLTGLSGSQGSWQPGELYECDAAEAARLVDAGFAEAPGPKTERAVKSPRTAKRAAGG